MQSRNQKISHFRKDFRKNNIDDPVNSKRFDKLPEDDRIL